MCICISVWFVYFNVMPNEGAGFLGAGITGCESLEREPGDWTQDLCKRQKASGDPSQVFGFVWQVFTHWAISLVLLFQKYSLIFFYNIHIAQIRAFKRKIYFLVLLFCTLVPTLA